MQKFIGHSWEGSVVDKVEDAHLVEVEDDLELVGGDDVEALVAPVDLGQRGDEARLLHLHLFQDVLNSSGCSVVS